MELRLLGSVELVTPDGATRALGSPKQRALLAALGLRAGEVVPVWRLVDELWPHQPPGSGATTLQSHVSGLRRVVGGSALRSSREGGYVLAVEPGNVDVHRFEGLVDTGEAALARGDAAAAPASCAGPSSCGAARRWPTCPTARSRRPPGPGWPSATSKQLRRACPPTWPRDATPS